MSFPILKEVYEYNNKKYTLLAQTLFYKVYIHELLQDDNTYNSRIYEVNWWKFAFNSKHIYIQLKRKMHTNVKYFYKNQKQHNMDVKWRNYSYI